MISHFVVVERGFNKATLSLFAFLHDGSLIRLGFNCFGCGLQMLNLKSIFRTSRLMGYDDFKFKISSAE